MDENSTRTRSLTGPEQDYAIKTWSYLRAAMVVLVAGLAVSILIEVAATEPTCVRGSISAYYYTPVHSFFVGVLVSLGVCMFCLKGSTEVEDTLLNLAGMFAPVVALVPMSSDDLDDCVSAKVVSVRSTEGIENNFKALLFVGTVGLVILIIRAWNNEPARAERNGFVFAGLVLVGAAAVFWGDRSLFLESAHWTAAGLMFACIFLVVCVNAWSLGRKTGLSWRRKRYAAVAGAMFVSSAVIGAAWKAGWDHGAFAIETVNIVLFAVFWVLQTSELRKQGLRPRSFALTPVRLTLRGR